DASPSCFLLQPQSLCGAVLECRQSVAQSLRAFDYPTYSPYISNVFGPEFVVEEGSAIEELFPAKPVGRPRKLRVQIPDSKLNYQILSQAVDEATHEHYLLLVADGDSLAETRRVSTKHFPAETLNHWRREAEKKFPWFKLRQGGAGSPNNGECLSEC